MTTVTILPASGEALASLRAFAEQPRNLYCPGGAGATAVPGDDPRFTREVDFTVVNTTGPLSGRLRVVFTHTAHHRRPAVARHASFSLSWADRETGVDDDLPPPPAVQAVCFALGFEGGFSEWMVGFQQTPSGRRIAIVAQEIKQRGDHVA